MTADILELRLRAEGHLRDDYAPALLDLVPELRDDSQQWPHVWAPAAAIAAHRAGRWPDAVAYLLEAIDAGFSQPEFFEGDLEACLADHPDWPAWLARMRANVPPPPIELLTWPAPRPALPLELSQIDGGPEREAELRTRLPEPKPPGTPRASSWRGSPGAGGTRTITPARTRSRSSTGWTPARDSPATSTRSCWRKA